MSKELGPIHYSTGAGPLKAILLNAAGQVRRVAATAAWEAITAATFANCTISVAEEGSSGLYYGDLPAGLSVDTDYTAIIYPSAAAAFSATAIDQGLVGPGSDDLVTDVAAVQTFLDALPSLDEHATAVADKVELTLPQVVASAIWDALTATFTTVGSGGKFIYDALTTLLSQVGSIVTGNPNPSIMNPVGRGVLSIQRADAYDVDDTRALIFVKASGEIWPDDITGATVTLSGTRNASKVLTAGDAGDETFSWTGTVVTPTGASQTVRFEPTSADTDNLSVGTGSYNVWVKASGGSINASPGTLWTGVMNVGANA